MTAIRWLQAIWEILTASPHQDASAAEWCIQLDFVPDAPLMAYLENHPEPIVADSPGLLPTNMVSQAMADVRLLVPLVAQGRLVGLLSLGSRRGSQAYSADELIFLATLADEAAAAGRIAHLRSGQAVRQLTVPLAT